jgi:hypothetical protein
MVSLLDQIRRRVVKNWTFVALAFITGLLLGFSRCLSTSSTSETYVSMAMGSLFGLWSCLVVLANVWLISRHKNHNPADVVVNFHFVMSLILFDIIALCGFFFILLLLELYGCCPVASRMHRIQIFLLVMVNVVLRILSWCIVYVR